MAEVDLANRDPNAIHGEMKVNWEECFAEPNESLHSLDFVWRISFKVFQLIKLWWYRIITLFCGICLACEWAMIFAEWAFCQIWCLTPCCKFLDMVLQPMKTCLELLTSCIIRPCFESIGYLFYNIRIVKE